MSRRRRSNAETAEHASFDRLRMSAHRELVEPRELCVHSFVARAGLALVIAATVLSGGAAAHVGSPDVFLDGQAGPYRVLVTVRPPYAVPGIADVEILTTSS